MSNTHLTVSVAALMFSACLQGCATTSAVMDKADPIPLHSTDPRYSGYLDRVGQMIKGKWGYPCVKDEPTGRCEYKAAKVTIEFGLLPDGRVDYVAVTKKADWDIYDKYATNAIKLASPFPRVPATLMAQAQPGNASVRILAAFDYKSGQLSGTQLWETVACLPDTVDPRGAKGK